ncbi:nucleolar protein 6-like [Tropilaelaps mercedesae]|uniref:Nucleolar protein 6 n=1 Tax=Tropilaelaps mercedesae TaxID=418985 RepID=A0A1V9XDD4_9ACAR|nr:nucleolar protein 6-like [Tropilaelaps mercedesae]
MSDSDLDWEQPVYSDQRPGSDASDNDETQHGPVPKKARQQTRKKKHVKAASFLKGLKAGEEMRTLTDFETNVVTLQIHDILEDISITEKQRQLAMSWFAQLKQVLLKVRISKKHAQNVQVPLRPLPEDCQIANFTFHSPKDVSLVGSFAYETAVKESSLDIAVEMPKDCFVKWDYHNVKYHRKRALYLSYLVAALQKNPSLYSKLHWCVDGDDRLPILVVTSPSADITAHILPFPEEGVFKLSRFAPDKLNIQERFYSLPPNSRKPVPIYNGGVLQDMLMIPSRDALSEQLSSSNGIRGGIQILKLWLRTKELCSGPDGFKSFHLTAYVEQLLRSGRLNSVMGVYQVVRAVLAQIQAEDWTSEGLLGDCSPATRKAHRLMVAHGASAVLVDRSHSHNILYRVSAGTLDLLRSEARAALQSLNSGSVTLINDLLSTPVPFYRKLDCYARIELDYTNSKQPTDQVGAWARADFGGSVLWPTSRTILATLRRAFGRRVSLLVARPLPALEWELGKDLPEEATSVEIGWNLNPDEVHHIEKGPPADSPEADEFRDFWGEKCEIRRFQDGSILETVVWPNETAEERKHITHNICDYILRKQHQVRKTAFSGELCDRLLHLPNCHFTQRYGTGDELLVDINIKFNELAKILRKLPDLPADVTTVHGTSEELCYTAVFPQIAAACDTDNRLVTRVEGRCVPRVDHGIPRLVRPIDVLLSVDCSKWPDELNALRVTKTLFYVALAKKLEGRECQVFNDHLLVLFQGLLFRVRAFCLKEIPLTKQEVSPDGMIKHIESKVSQRLEFECVVLPKLISALHGLHLQHATFGPACRIAKRWLSCHLLSDAIPSVAVDLLMAYVYIHPLPFAVPHSSRAGFQRFLHILATFDWRLNPLIVNFNSQFSPEALQQTNSYFTRNRTSLPPLYIRTPYEKRETSWITAEKPIGPVLKRASVLARKCLAFMEARMAEGHNVFGIFKTSLDVYDFVIQLDERYMATRHLNVNSNEKLSFTKMRDEIPVVDFDPVKFYLDDLQATYGHFCAFFYDSYGGTEIGGLWIPKSQAPVPFKVHSLVGRKLISPAKVLAPNHSAILSDLKILGQGLVKNVVEQRCPSTMSRLRKDSR